MCPVNQNLDANAIDKSDNLKFLSADVTTIQSFARRGGRMTDGQKKALKEGQHLIVPENEISDRIRGNKTVIDVGFGMGQTLVEIAQSYPNYYFLGIEVYVPGVASLMRQLHEKQIPNVGIVFGDAVFVLDQLIPRESVQKIQLFFPDPWPKKRHHKRRIIRLGFLKLVERVLVSGGELHVATDWQPYSEELQELIAEGSALKAVRNSLVLRPKTKYEQRGVRLGHQITDLYFQKS